jgi:transcriptional regulator with GAF, ATPase, and Fis domain
MDWWEQVYRAESTMGAIQRLLQSLRQELPVQSLVLYQLDPAQRAASVVCAATQGPIPVDARTIRCTESKWSELIAWLDDGEVLRQHGPRRSGKLAYLTPDSYAGWSVGIPLRGLQLGRDGHSGSAILELDHGRAIRDDQWQVIERLRGPLWFLLLAANAKLTHASESSSLEEGPSATKDIIVGADSGLRSVMERVEIVAPSDMPVLILGDTGTGKEVVARAIHQRSSRAGKPFIRVNCGAIPPELIDSQLFGHERGSFTGASDQRKGWFERADGGTLFLDEIGELPLAAQVRLLRVLQEHQIERVGGEEWIHVDVRIVAATHRDLASMVHQRTFREDLWYRINMFPILLPRLCERIEDIPALARHFSKRASANFGLPYVELASSDIKQLIEYRWPGNIRELQAVIDRAVILGRGIKLDIENALGIGIATRYEPAVETDEPTFYEVIPEQPVRRIMESADKPAPRGDNESELKLDALDHAIRRHIEKALVLTQGQIEGKRGAAHFLKINPHTLRAKMRKLGINWNQFRETS